MGHSTLPEPSPSKMIDALIVFFVVFAVTVLLTAFLDVTQKRYVFDSWLTRFQ